MTKTSKSAANVKTAPNHIIEFVIFDTPGFGPVPIIIRPEDDAWSDTVKKLAELQVNKWRSSYCDPEIMDVDLSRFCAAPRARLSHLSFESDRAFPAEC